jgi:hypothetical protein
VLTGGVSIYGGFAGYETELSQRDPVKNKTILSGDLGQKDDDADNAYHVLVAVGALGGTVLDGLTITGGNASGSGHVLINGQLVARDSGGGVVLGGSGDARLRNLVITDNQASNGTGGLIVLGDVNAIVENCDLEGNRGSTDDEQSPIEEPPEAPTKDPVEKPVEEPLEEPSEKPSEDPPDALTEEPVEEPTESSVVDNDASQPPATTSDDGFPNGVLQAQSAVDAVEELMTQMLPDVEIPLVGPVLTSPVTDISAIFGLPVPLMAIAFADGWAPVNLVLVVSNAVIMMALLYLALSSSGSAQGAFRRRRAVSVVSMAITLLSLTTVIATQDISLAVKPFDAASLWLLLPTVANILLLISSARPMGAFTLKPIDTRSGKGRTPRGAHDPTSLRPRPRRGTWLTENGDDEE